MRLREKVFGELAVSIIYFNSISVTKFLSDRLRIRATRRLYKGKIDRRYKGIEILFTIGPPNSKERLFLKRKGFIPKKIIINKKIYGD